MDSEAQRVLEITQEQFNDLAVCALKAVAYVEGWDGEHNCYLNGDMERGRPSFRFREVFRNYLYDSLYIKVRKEKKNVSAG